MYNLGVILLLNYKIYVCGYVTSQKAIYNIRLKRICESKAYNQLIMGAIAHDIY